MHISPDGIKLITKWEGYLKKLPDGRCTTYYCPAGVLTIGYGCTHGIKKGQIWTHDEAVAGLRREMDDIERAVNQYVSVDLTQAEYDAIVSFTYNCGAGALRKSTLLKRLNAGNKEAARRQLIRWNRGGGRVLRGLTNRRLDEQAHWLKDLPIYDPGNAVENPDKKPVKKDTPDDVGITGDIIDDLSSDPMAQSVDEPPPAKEILKSSRKFSLIQWLRGIFGFSAFGSSAFLSAASLTEVKGYMGIVKGLLAEYGVQSLIVIAVIGFITSTLLGQWAEEDVDDARYTPSGGTDT